MSSIANPSLLAPFGSVKCQNATPAHITNTLNRAMLAIDDGCGANAFAAWENKLYVVVCGGIPGVVVRTTKKIVLSLGITIGTEDFFDPHYLTRNLASLFGIPESRMRVPKIVAGSERRRLEGGGDRLSATRALRSPDPSQAITWDHQVYTVALATQIYPRLLWLRAEHSIIEEDNGAPGLGRANSPINNNETTLDLELRF